MVSITCFLGIFLLILSAYHIFNINDVDYQQGAIFKIIYLHVPASWWAIGIYTLMATSSLMAFITKIPQFHLITKFLAIPGIIHTIISLLSGMIWGYFTWGTFWVWDARLTSMFIHFMAYLGYILLVYQSDKNNEKNYMLGAILVIIGTINIPLIKWSVDWWFTLHQSNSISIFGKNAIHQSFLSPLFLNVIAFLLCSMAYVFYKIKKKF